MKVEVVCLLVSVQLSFSKFIQSSFPLFLRFPTLALFLIDLSSPRTR